MGKTLHMETTSVSVIKTCGEIEDVLVKHGVRQVWKKFNDKQEVDALEFVMPIDGVDIYFKLPLRWVEIQRLARQGKTGTRAAREEPQARRIAARLILRWVQAQFALIDTGMVQMDEVYLPYATAPSGLTYFEYIQGKGGLKALTAPPSEKKAEA